MHLMLLFLLQAFPAQHITTVGTAVATPATTLATPVHAKAVAPIAKPQIAPAPVKPIAGSPLKPAASIPAKPSNAVSNPSPMPGRWTGKAGSAVSLALLPRMLGGSAYTVRPVGPQGRRLVGFAVTNGNLVGKAPAAGKYVMMVFGTVNGKQQFQMAFFDVTP